MLYMPLKLSSWEWDIHSFSCQECWLLTTPIWVSLGQKLCLFLGYTASLWQNSSNDRLTNEYKSPTILTWIKQTSKAIWTPKLTIGSVEAPAFVWQKQKKKNCFSVQPYFSSPFYIYFSKSSWMQISTSDCISKIIWPKRIGNRIDRSSC